MQGLLNGLRCGILTNKQDVTTIQIDQRCLPVGLVLTHGYDRLDLLVGILDAGVVTRDLIPDNRTFNVAHNRCDIKDMRSRSADLFGKRRELRSLQDLREFIQGQSLDHGARFLIGRVEYNLLGSRQDQHHIGCQVGRLQGLSRNFLGLRIEATELSLVGVAIKLVDHHRPVYAIRTGDLGRRKLDIFCRSSRSEDYVVGSRRQDSRITLRTPGDVDRHCVVTVNKPCSAGPTDKCCTSHRAARGLDHD